MVRTCLPLSVSLLLIGCGGGTLGDGPTETDAFSGSQDAILSNDLAVAKDISEGQDNGRPTDNSNELDISTTIDSNPPVDDTGLLAEDATVDDGVQQTDPGPIDDVPTTPDTGNWLVFDGNGGSCEIEPVRFTPGKPVDFSIDGDLVHRDGYVFRGWGDKPDETGELKLGGTFYETFETPGTITLYAHWFKKYELLATGPGGGTIFYDRTKEHDFPPWWEYLEWLYFELAPLDQEINGLPWSPSTLTFYVGATGIGMWDGKANTDTIIDKLGYIELLDPYTEKDFGHNYAAYRARRMYDSIEPTMNDWYLPAERELYGALNTIGPYLSSQARIQSGEMYWTSSEGYLSGGPIPQDSRDKAYACWYTQDGFYCSWHNKENRYKVRPIRRF